MNSKKFSLKVKKVISRSSEEAKRLGHDYIGTEHLLLGIFGDKDELAMKVLQSLDVDTAELRQSVEETTPRRSQQSVGSSLNVDRLPLNKQAEKALKVTLLEAKILKSDEIHTEHLLLSILKDKENAASRLLNEYDVDYDSYKAELEFVRQEMDMTAPEILSAVGDNDSFDDESERGYRGGAGAGKTSTKSKTPVLDNFGRDVSRLARSEERRVGKEC